MTLARSLNAGAGGLILVRLKGRIWMGAGYVYILINHSMPRLLKIGRTARDSRARARELSNTSLPTPYSVAFEVFSDACEDLEQRAHAQLDDFRVARNREFFRYPLDKAIELLLQLSSPPSDEHAEYMAEDIFDRLLEKYRVDLKPDIVAIRIVQTHERVWLEVTQEEEIAGYLRDQIITRTDLAFIMGEPHDQSFFPPSDTVSENARRFVDDYDAYSITMTTDLFHEDACRRIGEDYRGGEREAERSADGDV